MSDLVGNPEDRFSQNEAHLIVFGLPKTEKHTRRYAKIIHRRIRGSSCEPNNKCFESEGEVGAAKLV